MKSKKIVALIVAFAAFMAVATSGLAAVTSTTTTYLTDKVEVTAVVGAEAGKEVTYLVADSDGDIVYIDQKTATGGTATFEYKIAKNKIPDLVTSVKLGTDGNVAVNEGSKDLLFNGVTVDADQGVKKVTFHADENCNTNAVANTFGNGDEVWAKIELVDDDYELASVTVANVEKEKVLIHKVAMGQTIVIRTTKKEVTPEVKVDETILETSLPAIDEKYDDSTRYIAKSYALKVTGSPTNAGILVGETFYEAMKAPGEVSYDANKTYAVRIIDVIGGDVEGTPEVNVVLDNVAN